jgi:hypothetical protein
MNKNLSYVNQKKKYKFETEPNLGKIKPTKYNKKNIIYYDNGDYYTGKNENDIREGMGKYIWKNGNEYTGQWKDGKRNGRGIYKNTKFGYEYTGEWKDNLKHGRGIEKYDCGNIFKGTWINGEKTGKFKIIYENNFNDGFKKFIGEYSENEKCGHGTMEYANGDIYSGNWIQGKIVKGNGIMKYYNGDIYEENNLMDGRYYYGSHFRNLSSDFYNINDADGKYIISGTGKMKYLNGDIYIGNWFYGKKKNGTYKYSNGDIYFGNFYNEQYNDSGELIKNDGKDYDGIWKNNLFLRGNITLKNKKYICNNFVNNIPFGYCIIEYQDNNIYYGNVYDFEPNGFGKMIYSNGDIDVGIWNNGKLTNEKPRLPDCHICSKYYEPEHFRISCGKCKNSLCNKCFESHYKNIKSGDIIIKNNICCPFCRQISLYIEIQNELLNLIKEGDFYKIGKCKICDKYEKLEEIPCIEGYQTYDDIYKNGFACGKCFIANETQKCPKCEINIEKNGGCNHITCNCGYEFCWVCLKDWNGRHYICNNTNTNNTRLHYYRNNDNNDMIINVRIPTRYEMQNATPMEAVD